MLSSLKQQPGNLTAATTTLMKRRRTVNEAQQAQEQRDRVRRLCQKYVSQRLGQRLLGLLSPLKKRPTHDLADFVFKLMESVHRPRHADNYVVTVTLMASEYIDRCLQSASAIVEAGSNNFILSLLSASFVLAINQLDDYVFSNRDWAAKVGISLKELNRVQVLICKQLDWKLFISPQAYDEQFNQVVAPQHVPQSMMSEQDDDGDSDDGDDVYEDALQGDEEIHHP